LTKRHPIVVSWISVDREYGDSAFGITNGARLMLSTPPAMTRSASPARIARAAIATASKPEPHSRFTVPPGTCTGRSASRPAMRATFRLSSPAWFAHPRTMSSVSVQSTERNDWVRARTTCAARSSGRTDASAPPYLPIGVRTPDTRYAVVIRGHPRTG
jgi:hypothetical protein